MLQLINKLKRKKKIKIYFLLLPSVFATMAPRVWSSMSTVRSSKLTVEPSNQPASLRTASSHSYGRRCCQHHLLKVGGIFKWDLTLTAKRRDSWEIWVIRWKKTDRVPWVGELITGDRRWFVLGERDIWGFWALTKEWVRQIDYRICSTTWALWKRR